MSVLDSDFIYAILLYKLKWFLVHRSSFIVSRTSFLEQRISDNGYRTTDIEQRKSKFKKNQRITFKILSKRIPLEPLIKIDWFSKGFFLRYSSKS
jgi:hypothetical protein